MGIESIQEAGSEIKSVEGYINTPEYQTKLNNAVDDAKRFAERVKAVAEGNPTDADIKQLNDEYRRISESALIAHDSIPDFVNNLPPTSTGGRIKGTDGLFMGSVRIPMFKVLGDGDYGANTPARQLFESKIHTPYQNLHENRTRQY